MQRVQLGFLVLAVTLALCVPTVARAEEANLHQRLIEAKAGAVVHVKFTLNVPFGSQYREFNRELTGVVVDPTGLVMLPSNAFQGFMRGRDQEATPSKIRVIFPGDDKEYDAILGAKDSKLGLAFLLIKDLEGREIKPIDLSQTTDAAVGDVLYGVSRLGQGFDYAAYCGPVRVLGRVTKPRKMLYLDRQAASSFVAEPLYDEAGAVAGIVSFQEGVGGGGGVFLISLKVARSTVTRSLKKAQEALEEALEREKEDAEKAAAEEAAEKDDGEGDGDSEGDGKDDGKDGDE